VAQSRRAAAEFIDLNPSVYIAFVTSAPSESTSYLDRVAESNPGHALLVAAHNPPHRGQWIKVRRDEGIGETITACRQAVSGRTIAGAAIHSTRHGGNWRMRIAALTLAGPALRIYNDNLDHFPLRDFHTLCQHLAWRWTQRSRGRLWWAALANLALVAAKTPVHRRPRVRTALPERQTAPGVSVVIPTRNGRDLLTAMLPAVTADLQFHSGEIIVIDNGSFDGTASFVREKYPSIQIDSTHHPLSFAEAVNRGIALAHFSHVVLLNNDMQLEPGFFGALRQAFDRIPNLFCATAQIFFPEGQRREETGLCFWRKGPGDQFPIYCAEPEGNEDGAPVLYGSGGCSMYDAAKLRKLGGFDEAYKPAYVEDLDIGYRAWLEGWPTAFCANAKVEHRHRATTSRYYKPGYLDYLVERNYLRFVVRATGDIFPGLWSEAITRLYRRALNGDKPSGAALRSAWKEALNRYPNHARADERALKQNLTH
jgi:GT2 family glycosyltransferase